MHKQLLTSYMVIPAHEAHLARMHSYYLQIHWLTPPCYAGASCKMNQSRGVQSFRSFGCWYRQVFSLLKPKIYMYCIKMMSPTVWLLLSTSCGCAGRGVYNRPLKSLYQWYGSLLFLDVQICFFTCHEFHVDYTDTWHVIIEVIRRNTRIQGSLPHLQ